METGSRHITFTGHKSYVSSVSFSPDGRSIASGSSDGSIRIWDLSDKNGNRVGSTDGSRKPNLWISGDGHTLATRKNRRFAQYWNLRTLKGISELNIGDDADFVTFSRDGSIVASVTFDGTISIWDVETGKLRVKARPNFSRGNLEEMVLSPNGEKLAMRLISGQILLWEITNKSSIMVYSTEYRSQVNAMIFSPDTSMLAFSGENGSIKLFDLATRQIMSTISGDWGEVYSLGFSLDASSLAFGTFDKKIRICDLAAKQVMTILSGHQSPVDILSFAPDGHTLVSGANDSSVRLWDLMTNTEVRKITFQPGSSIDALCFNSRAVHSCL